MNTKSMACDDQQLRDMLRTDDFGTAQEELMRHVEQCSYCQHRLEELAAHPGHWKKVGEALSADSTADNTVPAQGDCSRNPYARWPEAANPWTESMARQMLSPPSHPEMLGRLGRYEVERMIGAGGMGVVFKAFDSELNRPVAVKVLAPFLAGSGSARRRFSREARAAAAIVHEHVVPIHNVETERDAPFLVMQFIAGESLQSRIDRDGPLQTCEILRIGMQVASGLAAAHQQGIVHRDIKPSNILLEQGVDRALITDFGLARAVDDATLTRSGIHPGTPQFMSPEQAAGEPLDARSDQFSLGSVLYTMCTGRAPFRAASSLGVLRRIADDEPRRIREINPGVPDWLCGIIGKLMAKKPSDRFRTAADAAALLGQCLAHLQQPDFIPLPSEAFQLQAKRTTDASTTPQRRKVGSHMTRIVVALVALSGLVAAYFLQPSPPTADLAALQGEWVLIASERDGKALPADQLFNERLIIKGTQFSRPQTAPDGTEIKGESGRLSIPTVESENAIDFNLWEGTVHGLYKLKDQELVLCVSRDGGRRPDSFTTTKGDSRVLQTFRRKQKPAGGAEKAEIRERDRTWSETWMKKIPKELSGSIDRDAARKWMLENGFQNIVSAEMTLEVMQRIHPGVDEQSFARDGIRGYVYGLIRSDRDKRDAIEAYCLFGADDKLRALHVGPQVTEKIEAPASEAPGQNRDSE